MQVLAPANLNGISTNYWQLDYSITRHYEKNAPNPLKPLNQNTNIFVLFLVFEML